jgi:hypothetical protein
MDSPSLILYVPLWKMCIKFITTTTLLIVLREANQVADDRLAKHGLSLNIDFKIFNVVPSLIYLPLWTDSVCISLSHGF